MNAGLRVFALAKVLGIGWRRGGRRHVAAWQLIQSSTAHANTQRTHSHAVRNDAPRTARAAHGGGRRQHQALPPAVPRGERERGRRAGRVDDEEPARRGMRRRRPARSLALDRQHATATPRARLRVRAEGSSTARNLVPAALRPRSLAGEAADIGSSSVRAVPLLLRLHPRVCVFIPCFPVGLWQHARVRATPDTRRLLSRSLAHSLPRRM